jgi:alkylation response protein AidB-like acyl-CoA dehydrogenase
MGAFSRAFYKKLGEAGYLSLTWPKEYGGRGESLMKQYILLEELARSKAPFCACQLIETVPHLIIEHGSERARTEVLPKIRSGDLIFWLGYTEPDAGSDLLALKTTAILEGDYYVVNGQKSSSTWAHASDWVLLLACTDPKAPRGKGLSLLLVDKTLPGVSITPVINLSGIRTHNMVFLDDVKVHKDFIIGTPGSGLKLMFAGLESDRFWGRAVKPHFLERVIGEVVAFLKNDPLGKELLLAKPWARDALAQLRMDTEVCRLFSLQCITKLNRGMKLTYEASVLKLYSEEVGVRLFNTLIELFGPLGVVRESQRLPFAKDLYYYYLGAISLTIAGGTAEIQRDTINRFVMA